jgi:queuine/archaeosine tRNA-ribosyltransferase
MSSYPRTLWVGSTRLACPAVCVPTQCGGVHNGMRDTTLALSGADGSGDALAPLFAARAAHFWGLERAVAASGAPLRSFCSGAPRGAGALLTLCAPSGDAPRLAPGGEALSARVTPGVRPLGVAWWCGAVAALAPCAVVALADEAPPGAGVSRRRAAAARSLRWLAAAAAGVPAARAAGDGRPLPALFASVPAVAEPAALAALAAAAEPQAAAAPALAPLPVAGWAFGRGFWDAAAAGGGGSLRVAALADAARALPAHLPRLLVAPCNPAEAVDAWALCGVDVLDSDYAAVLALAGRALTFALDDDGGGGAPPPACLDLRDAALALAQAPVAPGCPCFACAGVTAAAAAAALPARGLAAGGAPAAQPPPRADGRPPPSHPGHTRAYIHHLIVCNEITGKALLVAHNAVHMARLAAAARARARAGGAPALRAHRDWFAATYGGAGAFPPLAALLREAREATGGRDDDAVVAAAAAAAAAAATAASSAVTAAAAAAPHA